MKSAHRAIRPRSSPSTTSPTIPSAEVLAHFTDAVVVLDTDRRVVLMNQAAEELTGQPESRVLGLPWLRLFPETHLIGEMIDRVQRLGQSESRSEEQIQLRGAGVSVRVTCLPLWDESDRVHGTALVIHDLSYQRTLEESARRNESLARLGTLVAGLAHEVRNPLAGIKGAAQLLEGRLAADPTLAEYTRVITREVNRLSALVEDLLTLGSPPKPRLKPLNIHRVIQHVVTLVGEEMARSGVRLRCEFDPSLPDVRGDEAQLSQVLLNLLRNAIEAVGSEGVRPENRVIQIRTRMETDFHILRNKESASKFLRVEVADRGVGIAPADAARVFEPFFTTKPRGTGLGLAISHRIVADHGGIIRAFPQQPTGTVVIMTLPVAAD
jgi:two-component system nitrogen regulation sensor histidine kinase GlnL